jgi:hypothetical protein
MGPFVGLTDVARRRVGTLEFKWKIKKSRCADSRGILRV